MNFDYYYGDESNQFAFYRIPRQLITGEAFKKLSTDAKLLYGLLLDRMGLSAKNGWYDDMGRVFIYYTLDEIQEDLNCGHEKAVRLLAELDTGKKGFGLIERVKQGQGRPTKIYVKRFTTRAIPPQPAAPQDIPRLPIFGSQDFGKAEVKSSEKQKSRLPVIGSADFRKSDTSYIESNQTDLSQLYPSIHPSATVPESRWIDRSECRREVQEAIEFPLLCQQFGYEDVESVTELIVDTLAQEKAIFSKFSEIEAEWRKQAAETIAIRKAREYLRALPVEHTSNQWKVNQFGWNVLSNMVYKMSYRVSENKTPDGTLINCTLSWDIHYNTLQHPTPDYTGDGWKIAGQSDKRFATKEELERYLQGRIKAYAHLFTEVSPPIPKGEERRFSVNGILLPGYTVEASLEERVEEMLSFLEDDPALLEEPLSSGHQDTPQEEEPTMAQKLHTTPLNQHRNRESVQKPETARKGPKKPPRRKTAPVR